MPDCDPGFRITIRDPQSAIRDPRSRFGIREDRGWIASFWGTSENNRRARYYRLTPKGRTQLASQTNRWDEIVRAVNRILRPASE